MQRAYMTILTTDPLNTQKSLSEGEFDPVRVTQANVSSQPDTVVAAVEAENAEQIQQFSSGTVESMQGVFSVKTQLLQGES